MTGPKVAERSQLCVVHGRHKWRFRGRGNPVELERQGVEVPNCERPSMMGCNCGEWFLMRCQASGRAKCRPCSESYRRRVRRVAGSGIVAMHLVTYMLTLTAPSDRGRHKRGRSGLWCPCTPEGGVDLATWNGTMAARWNHFVTDVRRTIGPCEYFAAKEVQRRGALHLHVPLRFDRPTRVQLRQLRLLAIRHGFGHEVDLQELSDDRAAWYVSKYVTKASDEREAVPFVNCRTGEVGPGRWRTWSASREWGESMASVRATQRAWWRAGAASSDGGPGEGRPGDPHPGGVGEADALDSNTLSYATGGRCATSDLASPYPV